MTTSNSQVQEANVGQASLKLLTVTWSADKAHFSLLNDSLKISALAGLQHDVVVQDEDLPLFLEFQRPGLSLISTRDLLPQVVENRRRDAVRWQKLWGRRGVTLGGSLSRSFGWPRWVRYTGWHTQQLSKLARVAASEVDTVVILDSDVVVTHLASAADFISDNGFICLEKWQDAAEIGGKISNWQATAHELFDQKKPTQGALDCYFDTPFVMHAPTVRNMLAWLERKYAKPWWQVLVELPPRRWSEFGIYKRFVRSFVSPEQVQWRPTDFVGYLFDASDTDRLLQEFAREVEQNARHYVTIHSQSNGRHTWGADSYSKLICQRLTQEGQTQADAALLHRH